MSKEIMMVVDAVSNEKGVDKEVIFEALEAALASATRKKHGEEWDVRVAINRKSGDYDTFRRWKVFADDSKELEVPDRELRLEDALDVNPAALVGGFVEEPIESVAFGRIAAQQARAGEAAKVPEICPARRRAVREFGTVVYKDVAEGIGRRAMVQREGRADDVVAVYDVVVDAVQQVQTAEQRRGGR